VLLAVECGPMAGRALQDGIEYLLWRHELADGHVTTLYAVRHPRPSTRARVVHFPGTERLDVWCTANQVDEAIIGGFFVRDPYRPLGELWIDGNPVPHEPIPEPYASRRACVAVDGEGIRLIAREHAPATPPGDLVQAGPLLVAGGESGRRARGRASGDAPRRAGCRMRR
jgi:hypothetical protein